MTKTFFDEKRAAAVLKHGILGRYLRLFCSKAGYRAQDNRVIYLDGYAGPGMYSDGQPGSPALAVATAESLSSSRDLLGIYVEENLAAASELERNLAATSHKHKVLKGDLHEMLREALSYVRSSDPLFAFFDPFGLTIPLAQLKEVMAHAGFCHGFRRGPATELLLNFSYPGLRRVAGHLTAPSQNPRYLRRRETILERLDATLGGTWWRPIWTSGAEDRLSQIADGYRKEVMRQTSARGSYRVPVRSRLRGPILYDLMFFTYYPEQGLWHFNDCVSLALTDYYEFCTRCELNLDPQSEREARWVKEIRTSIEKLLSSGSPLKVHECWVEMYGSCLGYAREKHLRKAIKELHEEGVVDYNRSVKLQETVITRTNP